MGTTFTRVQLRDLGQERNWEPCSWSLIMDWAWWARKNSNHSNQWSISRWTLACSSNNQSSLVCRLCQLFGEQYPSSWFFLSTKEEVLLRCQAIFLGGSFLIQLLLGSNHSEVCTGRRDGEHSSALPFSWSWQPLWSTKMAAKVL